MYFGWGEPGRSRRARNASRERLDEGTLKARLKCDPDGAGARMADFVHQMGGTEWAGVSTQFFQTGAGGEQTHHQPDRRARRDLGR